MNNYSRAKKWLAGLQVQESEVELLNRAIDCLLGNIVTGNDAYWGDRRMIIPSKSEYIGVWNWDSAFHSMATSSWDLDLSLDQIELFIDNQKETGAYIDAMLVTGEKYINITKPPIIYPAFWRYYEKSKNTVALKKFYDSFLKNEKFWVEERKVGRLFHYGASDIKDQGEWERHCKLESGWDNSVRWDEGAWTVWAIDLNCYMVQAYEVLYKMAKELGFQVDALTWETKRADLVEAIQTFLWDETLQAYCDYNYQKNTSTKVLSPASFMPLYIGIANETRAACMKKFAESRDVFYPMLPTVSYDNACYNSSWYWRGPTWLNVAYFAAKGLKNYGYEDLANDLKNKILNVCVKENRGIFEYYNSKTGEGLGAMGFGWSAAFIIEFILNF